MDEDVTAIEMWVDSVRNPPIAIITGRKTRRPSRRN